MVDAHQHFWDPELAAYRWMTDAVAPIRRRFAPDDLEPLLRAHGIGATAVAAYGLRSTNARSST
jgi:L-fucono-1,5-lactonase